MKILFAAFLIALSVPSSAAYFNTIISDPSHPKMSASMLYTSKMDFDGGVSDVAIIYHKADPNDSLWSKKLIDAGFPPISWTLLELGAGGNSQTGFAHVGTSVNAAPTLLGPLVKAMNGAGGKYATMASVISSPDGSGLKLGIGWKSNVVSNGGVTRFDRLRFPPRYAVGYVYQF